MWPESLNQDNCIGEEKLPDLILNLVNLLNVQSELKVFPDDAKCRRVSWNNVGDYDGSIEVIS